MSRRGIKYRTKCGTAEFAFKPLSQGSPERSEGNPSLRRNPVYAFKVLSLRAFFITDPALTRVIIL
jgi:hypothetical protein